MLTPINTNSSSNATNITSSVQTNTVTMTGSINKPSNDMNANAGIQPQENNESSSNSQKLSSGAIAGISISIVIVAGAVLVGFIYVKKRSHPMKAGFNATLAKTDKNKTEDNFNNSNNKRSSLISHSSIYSAGKQSGSINKSGSNSNFSSLNRDIFFKRFMVFVPYEAKMPDELTLKVGDVVLVTETFKDGWGRVSMSFFFKMHSPRRSSLPMR